ncbi:MAG TPA: hypothetical protein VFJ77_06725 [Gaiellaceae bacterium]|nr:hypothetical protein [Gaiellaceae bacterium]
MRRLPHLDGRVLAATAVVVFFAVLLGVRAANGSVPWATVGVAPGDLSFEDLRSVTSAWDCARRGVEAFPSNPCDPLGASGGVVRAANYPRLWIDAWHLGLGQGATVPLGIAVGVVFFAAALAVAGPLTLGEGAVYGAALLAPATLLGVERGNVDLLMFALVAVAVLLVRRLPWVAAAAVALAGALKLFPAAAVTLFLRGRPRWAPGAAAVAVLLAYAAATLSDIRTIRHAIPREVVNSYGAGVVVDALHDGGVAWAQSPAEVRWLRIGVVAIGLAAAGILALRRRAGGDAESGLRLDAFWAGASIYALSYVFGSNFDYRLAFLVLCVPQLCAWARPGAAALPGARLALGALLATLWLGSEIPPLPFGLQSWYAGLAFPPEEVLNWALFAWLTAAVVATAPALVPRFAWRPAR